ncbi:MAG: hypothetical protein IJ601_04255 [Acidaminococcaceae bacterium]|nr:hypothetical protein [Acidaminococcaceae bacterium]
MDVLTKFLERLQVFDLWAAAALIYAAGVKLCGPNYWPMVLLTLLLIFADTLTRWDCIVKKFILENDPEEKDIRLIKLSRVVVQFFRNETWSENYLTSRAFSRICEKMLIYGLALTIFFIAGQWIPEFHLFGAEIVPKNVFPGTITMVLFLIEISSINENLIELGYNGVSEYVQRIIDALLERIAPKKKGE